MTVSAKAFRYVKIGCVELINDARTFAYWQWAAALGKFDCGSCIEPEQPSFCDADGVPADYTDPVTDEVDWFDPAIPESADFLGMLVQRVVGSRSSTYSRATMQAVDEGTILQRERLDGRGFAFDVVLIATSCEGIEYGWEWVRRVLEGGTCTQTDECTSCNGETMCARVYCPDTVVDNGLRTWLGVGTTDGLKEVEEETFNCCCRRRGTFTLQSESPFSFSAEESLCEIIADEDDPGAFTECIRWGTFCVNCQSNDCVQCESCNADLPACEACREKCGQCDRCGFDPFCPELQPVLVPPLFIEQDCGCLPLRHVVQVCQLTGFDGCLDAALVIDLASGIDPANAQFTQFGLRNTQIKLWVNPASLPAPTTSDEYSEWLNKQTCSELSVSYIPSNSMLRIDGRTKRVTLTCDGVCRPFSQVVTANGVPVFPLIAQCHDLLMAVEFDPFATQFQTNAPAIPSSVNVTGFRRWRS